MRIFLLILSCSLLGLSGYGQEKTYEHLTVENGLPSNRVYHVLKDSRGFMWFSTDNGVCRYNGVEIETYTVNDGLANNDVFSCFEDKWGRIWFTTFNGELSFFKNERFYNQKNCSWLNSKVINKDKNDKEDIRYFQQSSMDSSFYVYYRQGNNCLRIYDKSVTLKYLPEPRAKPSIEDAPTEWLYRKGGKVFYIANRKKDNWQRRLYAIEKNKTTIHSSHILKHVVAWPFLDESGSCRYVNVPNGIFDFLSEKTLSTDLKERIYCFKRINQTEYLGTRKGLFIKTAKKKIRTLTNKHITSIAEGISNKLYFSTLDDGIYISQPSLYLGVVKIPNAKEIIYSSPKYTYYFDNQSNLNLKAGSNISKCSIKPYDSNFESPYDSNHIPIFYSTKGPFVFLNINEVSHIVDLKTPLKLAAATPNHWRSSDWNYAVTDSNVYLKELWSVYAISKTTGRTRAIYGVNYDKPITAKKNKFKRIFHLNKNLLGEIFFSSYNKFFKINGFHCEEIPSLSKAHLRHFEFIEDKLIGVDDNGNLIALDHYLDAPHSINLGEQGIQNIKKIDANKILFENTKKKLKLLLVKNDALYVHDIIPEMEAYRLNQLVSDSTSIYINSTKGVFKIPIEQIFLPIPKMRLYVKTISLEGKPIDIKNNYLNISYSERANLSISYIPTIYNSSSEVKYRYAILRSPKDTTWYNSKTPDVSLINPRSGKFDILFQATSGYNSKSNIIVTHVFINNPFYFTWWFIVITILGLVGITFLITKKVQTVKRKKELQLKEEEKKFIQAEFKSLNALMNPHFIFNSLNNIQGFINNDSKEDANKYLEVFSQLVRQNMHNVKVGSVTLEKEMNLVRNYLALEKMRFKEKIHFELKIDDTVELEDIFIPPLTIQPIVENSIKHGILPLKDKAGEIVITLNQLDNHVQITVQDNGVGLSDIEKSSGNRMALNAIKERFIQIEKMTGYRIAFHIKNRLDNNKVIGATASISIDLPNE